MFVVDSGASMHMLSKNDLRSDKNGHFAEVQSPYDGSDRKWRSADKRVSTGFCPWSLSVRNSAITRWNGNDSIDS